MADAPFLLQIDDLHKSFGDLEVLKGISLRVRPREVIIVIGPTASSCRRAAST